MWDADEIRSLFAYNRWANRRTLEAAGALSPEELLRDLKSSFPSVRNTLSHILAAEWIWLERWRGASPKSLLDPNEFPDLPSLRERWERIEAEQVGFLSPLAGEDLAREVSYVNTKGETWTYPLGRMMQHVVNHSSYHRGQVTTMLRQLGRRAVGTDLLLFLDEVPPPRPPSAGPVR